jgi:hypothetical protein
LAVVGVFLSGPYRTMQIKWPQIWGRRISTRAHGNVSLAATVAVFIHVGPAIGFSLAWVGTWLFLVSLISGFYGMYVARGPTSRRAWLRRHRVLTVAFYLAILPHVLGSLLGFAAIVAVVIGYAVWRWRIPMRDLLSRIDWPLRRRSARPGSAA